uniref:Uncharacterized protein n=1 Tax=Rhizophora mucronata TaxID=61149 RepID=A0A2P2QWF1_RHIMU
MVHCFGGKYSGAILTLQGTSAVKRINFCYLIKFDNCEAYSCRGYKCMPIS